MALSIECKKCGIEKEIKTEVDDNKKFLELVNFMPEQFPNITEDDKSILEYGYCCTCFEHLFGNDKAEL